MYVNINGRFLQSQVYIGDIDQYINICNWKCEKCGQCEEVFVLRMQKYLPLRYWWEISLLTKVGMCNVYYIPLVPLEEGRRAVGSKSITRNKNVLETSRLSLIKCLRKNDWKALAHTHTKISLFVRNTKQIDILFSYTCI